MPPKINIAFSQNFKPKYKTWINIFRFFKQTNFVKIKYRGEFMKKLIALSLTFALTGALGSTVCANLDPAHTCEECSALAFDEEQTTIDRDLLIGNGFMILHQDGVCNIVPRKPYNLNVNNGGNTTVNTDAINNNAIDNANNTTFNNANNTAFNNTNNQNIAYSNKGTSPYGIGNANSGVLPNNGNGNQTVDNNMLNRNTNQGNLDSMVRTNNVDTYKNNANQNIDNNVYNNNGTKINNTTNGTNNGLTSNYIAPTTKNNNNTNVQNGTNTNLQPKTATQNTNNVISNRVRANTSSDLTNTQNTTIQTLQNQLTAQKQEFNTKIQNINNLLNNYEGQTITLDAEQSTLMNGYMGVIEHLTQKLMKSRIIVAMDVDTLTNNTFDTTSTNSPYYLELKSMLGSRIVCFDCLNEALDNVAEILQNYANTNTTTNNTTLNNNATTTNRTTQSNLVNTTNQSQVSQNRSVNTPTNTIYSTTNQSTAQSALNTTSKPSNKTSSTTRTNTSL